MEENNFPGFIMIFHRNWQFATNFVVVLEKMSFCQFPATSDDSCGTLPVPMQTRNCVWYTLTVLGRKSTLFKCLEAEDAVEEEEEHRLTPGSNENLIHTINFPCRK